MTIDLLIGAFFFVCGNCASIKKKLYTDVICELVETCFDVAAENKLRKKIIIVFLKHIAAIEKCEAIS